MDERAPFDHLVLTRFNVPAPSDQNDKRGVSVTTPEWLRQRFDLFMTYCLPSMLSQTSSIHRWLIFFDTNTPDALKSRIGELSASSEFTPVYVSSRHNLVAEVNKHIPSETEFLITTRLDNDDALSRDALQKIQEEFRAQSWQAINLPRGYVLAHGKLYLVDTVGNPFLSVIERRSDGRFRTVWRDFLHDRLFHASDGLDIAGGPYWLQVIHERNLLNDWGSAKKMWLVSAWNRAKQWSYHFGLQAKPPLLFRRTNLSVGDINSDFELSLADAAAAPSAP